MTHEADVTKEVEVTAEANSNMAGVTWGLGLLVACLGAMIFYQHTVVIDQSIAIAKVRATATESALICVENRQVIIDNKNGLDFLVGLATASTSN